LYFHFRCDAVIRVWKKRGLIFIETANYLTYSSSLSSECLFKYLFEST
jgi:hypothetical protein